MIKCTTMLRFVPCSPLFGLSIVRAYTQGLFCHCSSHHKPHKPRKGCFVAVPVITCLRRCCHVVPLSVLSCFSLKHASRLSHCAECGFIPFCVKTRPQARFCPPLVCCNIKNHDKTSHRPNKAQICHYKAFWWLVDKMHDKSLKSRYKPILRRLRGIYTYMHARTPLPTRMRACDPHYARYPPPPD